jgi:putative ABC transport system permease protein
VLDIHLEDRYAELLTAGVSPEDAARQTLDELGDHHLMTRELARVERLEPTTPVLGDTTRARFFTGVWQDVRYGLRTLRASPGFTGVATLTIALGIGATTAIFSVVDAMLLRPLNADPDGRVVRLLVTSVRPGEGSLESRTRSSIPGLTSMAQWQQRREVFEAIGAWGGDDLTLIDSDPVERVGATAVTSDLFRVFEVGAPALGRLFSDADGDQPVVILGYNAWQRRFGGAADVIGHSIRTAEGTRTIVGVLAASFPFQRSTEFWIPMKITPRMATYGWGGNMLARLTAGVSWQQAQLALAGERHERVERDGARTDQTVAVVSMHEATIRWSRQMLYSLLGAVSCILLIGCVNVAGLLVARGSRRSREVAIRASLGARRSRLIRQFLTESLLLAAIGGIAGIVLAWALLGALVAVLPVNVPLDMRPTLDLRLLASAALITLGTGVALGLLPAIRLSRTDLATATKSAASNSQGATTYRTGRVLVAVEVALALVLLVGAGLMVRSLQQLLSIDSGFGQDDVLVVPVSPVFEQHADKTMLGGRADTFYREVVDRLGALPGVTAVGATTHMPFQSFAAAMATLDTPSPTSLQVSPRDVLPGYFAAMGVRLIAGRDFDVNDRAGHPCVAIVNEQVVRQSRLEVSPLGVRIKRREEKAWCEIVGVVADVKHYSLERESFAELYFAARQTGASELSVVLRASDPLALTPAVRNRLTKLPERTLVRRVAPFATYVDRMTADHRNRALLLSIVATLGLLLACVGIFGLTAYAVTRRTREIGVRVALGATPNGIIRTVLGSFVPAIAGGLGLGLLGAWAATRVIEQFLFGVEPHDPLTLAAVSVLLTSLALLACYLPARRAIRVDPVIALRTE